MARGRGGSLWVVSSAGLTLIPGAPYTVEKGDTLSHIARRYQTSVADLLDENPYLDTSRRKYGDLILPGDVIEMPSPLKEA